MCYRSKIDIDILALFWGTLARYLLDRLAGGVQVVDQRLLS